MHVWFPHICHQKHHASVLSRSLRSRRSTTTAFTRGYCSRPATFAQCPFANLTPRQTSTDTPGQSAATTCMPTRTLPGRTPAQRSCGHARHTCPPGCYLPTSPLKLQGWWGQVASHSTMGPRKGPSLGPMVTRWCRTVVCRLSHSGRRAALHRQQWVHQATTHEGHRIVHPLLPIRYGPVAPFR